MKRAHLLSSLRGPRKFAFLGLLVLFGVLALSACGGSNSVGVYDQARVLNVAKVKSAAAKLPHNVDIYTVNNFMGSQTDFQRSVANRLNGDPNRIVMGVDTVHHYMYMARGANVPLSNANISQTVNAFAANYGNGDYTKATTAALGTLNSTMNASTGPSFSPFALCCLPLLLIPLLFFIFKGRGAMPYRRPTFVSPGPEPTPGPYQEPPVQPGPYTQRGYGPTMQGREPGRAEEHPRVERNKDIPGSTDYPGGSYGRGGTFGRGGSEYGGSEYGGGGTFGRGGSEYGGSERGGGGTFDRGTDYEQKP